MSMRTQYVWQKQILDIFSEIQIYNLQMDFFLHLLKPNICNESYEINKICKKILDFIFWSTKDWLNIDISFKA